MLPVDFLEPAPRDMGINLCGGNAGMTQHHLDRAKIGAPIQEVRGKGVAQDVRVQGLLDAGLEGVCLQSVPEGLAAHALARSVDEEGGGESGSMQFGPGLPEINPELIQTDRSNRDDSFFGPLSQHPHERVVEPQIGDSQPDGFAP